jgi:hypothetical protein
MSTCSTIEEGCDDGEEVSSREPPVPPSQENILEQVRILIRENILPRLTDLEQEVRLLRKVTWPVCQGLRESGQLDDIRAKREFLGDLDPEEIRMLLRRKSTGSLLREEFDRVREPRVAKPLLVE